jgi:hypothetical protein
MWNPSNVPLMCLSNIDICCDCDGDFGVISGPFISSTNLQMEESTRSGFYPSGILNSHDIG